MLVFSDVQSLCISARLWLQVGSPKRLRSDLNQTVSFPPTLFSSRCNGSRAHQAGNTSGISGNVRALVVEVDIVLCHDISGGDEFRDREIAIPGTRVAFILEGTVSHGNYVRAWERDRSSRSAVQSGIGIRRTEERADNRVIKSTAHCPAGNQCGSGGRIDKHLDLIERIH